MIKNRSDIFLWCAVLLLAMALRLPNLQQRPMHTDEAVHAVKLADLLETGTYRYDADEYHGPTLYYFTAVTAMLRGQMRLPDLDEITLRLTPVLFGLGLILLSALCIPLIGRKAALASALWVAVSPVQVFYSRYFIQEVLFVFFSIFFLIAVFRYFATVRSGWALTAGCALGLLHATKETDVIILGVAAMAGLGLWLVDRLRQSRGNRCAAEAPAGCRHHKVRLRHITIFLLAAFAISGLLLSSFLTHPQGFLDSFKTYAIYLQRGAGETLHIHPRHYYLQLLNYFHTPGCPVFTEAWMLPFALIGIFQTFRRSLPQEEVVVVAFRRFLVFYTLGLALIYSAIPYKTPWNVLGFHHGLLLLAGIGLIDAVDFLKKKAVIAVLFAAIAAAGMIRQAALLNGKYACDPCNPWVYAHPGAGVEKVSRSVEAAVGAMPEEFDKRVEVIVPNHEYWPLPWTLRRLPHLGWYDRVDEQSPAAPIILMTPDQEPALLRKLYRLPPPGQQHLYMRLWDEYRELRPGVEIHGYARKDVWDAMRAEDAMKE